MPIGVRRECQLRGVREPSGDPARRTHREGVARDRGHGGRRRCVRRMRLGIRRALVARDPRGRAPGLLRRAGHGRAAVPRRDRPHRCGHPDGRPDPRPRRRPGRGRSRRLPGGGRLGGEQPAGLRPRRRPPGHGRPEGPDALHRRRRRRACGRRAVAHERSSWRRRHARPNRSAGSRRCGSGARYRRRGARCGRAGRSGRRRAPRSCRSSCSPRRGRPRPSRPWGSWRARRWTVAAGPSTRTSSGRRGRWTSRRRRRRRRRRSRGRMR